jgi:hypothetical protein
LFLIAAIGAAVYVHLLSETIPSRDTLYHLRHASLYVSRGIFMQEFPWAAYSIINSLSSDIWYGFHLLLIPFTFIHDPLLQIRITGIFLLAAGLLIFYLAMRKSRMSYPFFWPFLLAPFTWRLAMARPHVITIGLAALLLSMLASGGFWGVFLVSAALTFLHLTFFWLGVVVALVVTLIRLITERVFEWRKALAVLLGLTAGWLCRPNPVGAAKIVHVQLFKLMLEKQRETLLFGEEIKPVAPMDILLVFGPFVALLAGVFLISLVTLLLRRPNLAAQRRTLLWSGLALSLLFFGMSVFVSMRNTEQWAPFAVIFIACGFTCFLNPRQTEAKPALGRISRIILTSLAVLIIGFMLWHSMTLYKMYIGFGVNPQKHRQAAEWLKDNAKPGEIVFHAAWDVFPYLFYWNPQNRYIGGMDPVFQYAYDPALYWKVHHIVTGQASSLTWGTREIYGSRAERIYDVLVRDFGASYVFLDSRTPGFLRYISHDPRFVLSFHDRQSAIFRLSPTGQPVNESAQTERKSPKPEPTEMREGNSVISK